MRHLVSSPENGPVILTYGCSDCYWRYTPKTPEEACTMSLNAQVLFEDHDCAKFRMSQPEIAPTNPQKRSA
jgi:hypothetical protein